MIEPLGDQDYGFMSFVLLLGFVNKAIDFLRVSMDSQPTKGGTE